MSLEKTKERGSFIQAQIFELLNAHGKEIWDIEKIYYCAGPGSYTGMRMTEGLVGVLSLEGMESHGFYSYEIGQPWIGRAFKGEYFIFDGQEKNLVSEKKAREVMDSSFFTSQGEELFGLKTQSVFDRLKNSPSLLQAFKGSRKPYYYRPLEIEFSQEKKKD